MGQCSQKDLPKPEFTIMGYIKPEGNHWAAVCVNMCLVAQGKTHTEAFENLLKSVTSYCEFLKQKYPDEWQMKIHHESPDEFTVEFQQMLDQVKSIMKSMGKQKRRKQKLGSRPLLDTTPIVPGNVFVQSISAC